MAQLLVRKLEDDVKAKLQKRARRHGRSTEDEVRDILRNAVREEGTPPQQLGRRLRALFKGAGLGPDIEEMRGHPANPADFSPVIVLDTNVISAMMGSADEPGVMQWLDNQAPESIWTTAVTIFEVRFGLALLGRGRRRERLARAFTLAVNEVLGGRVLSFDEQAAGAAAEFAAERRLAGKPIDIRDVQIAGIVRVRHATLATRNTRHFEGMGISILNPWKA